MNYYQRIQASINHIEKHLYDDIRIEDLCLISMMSRANLYRMFFAMTGYQIKEYVRRRRIAEASKIMKSNSITYSALNVGFQNPETFTRAFKKITGSTPMKYKKNELIFPFERMNIMEKFITIDDQVLMNKYPDIKVLKEVPASRVAYYCYFGHDPETHAFEAIKAWAIKNEIDLNTKRIFGFNNPSPLADGEAYGYEIWVAIDDDLDVNDPLVKAKKTEGGLYAVTSVKGGIPAIFPTWQRLNQWLMESKYIGGSHQWLEEHLGFENNEHTGSIDLYMPISETNTLTLAFEDVPDRQIISLRKTGNEYLSAIDELIEYAFRNNLINDATEFFAFYDSSLIFSPDFWYEFCVTLPPGTDLTDSPYKTSTFKGGHYAVKYTDYCMNGNSWQEFLSYMKTSPDLSFAGGYSFFEQYSLEDHRLTMDTRVKQCIPVKHNP